jgi:hypothetical protein
MSFSICITYTVIGVLFILNFVKNREGFMKQLSALFKLVILSLVFYLTSCNSKNEVGNIINIQQPLKLIILSQKGLISSKLVDKNKDGVFDKINVFLTSSDTLPKNRNIVPDYGWIANYEKLLFFYDEDHRIRKGIPKEYLSNNLILKRYLYHGMPFNSDSTNIVKVFDKRQNILLGYFADYFSSENKNFGILFYPKNIDQEIMISNFLETNNHSLPQGISMTTYNNTTTNSLLVLVPVKLIKTIQKPQIINDSLNIKKDIIIKKVFNKIDISDLPTGTYQINYSYLGSFYNNVHFKKN